MEYFILSLLLLVIGVGLLAGSLTKAVKNAKAAKLRKEFAGRYGIELDSRFRIRKYNIVDPALCRYELGFARWEHARVNGMRDRRYNINRLMREPSVLMIDGWEISTGSPYLMADFIKELRNSGINISGGDISYTNIAAHSPKDAGIY